MAEFLTGDQVGKHIRRILAEPRARCAVAFWGAGAVADLFPNGARPKDALVICDISMGATSADELCKLGAPDDIAIRYQRNFHAKVYLSEAGAVVGSANASSNGIGFGGEAAGLVEAATFHAADSAIWRQVSDWFDRQYAAAAVVDEAALDLAKQLFRPGRRVDPPREGSLLELALSLPSLFAGIGFVFSSDLATPAQQAKARASAARKAPRSRAKELRDWPEGKIYVEWESEVVDAWPGLFFSFVKLEGRRLQVNGHLNHFKDSEHGSVFVSAAWRSLAKRVGGRLPTKDAIATADAALAERLIKHNGGAVMYPDAYALGEAILDLERSGA